MNEILTVDLLKSFTIFAFILVSICSIALTIFIYQYAEGEIQDVGLFVIPSMVFLFIIIYGFPGELYSIDNNINYESLKRYKSVIIDIPIIYLATIICLVIITLKRDLDGNGHDRSYRTIKNTTITTIIVYAISLIVFLAKVLYDIF